MTQQKFKIKHVIDRRNHLTMTRKKGESERESILNTVSADTIVPSDKEIIKNNKVSMVHREQQDVNKNELKSSEKVTVEAETKESKK